MGEKSRYDVVIIGGGLAGLSLVRHLLLSCADKTILLLEKRAALPPKGQKVGESTVQLSGYYFSKVLGLEEHLLREHFLKYNLRFNWKTPGRDGARFEDYSQSYIRSFSNIAGYQLDRNRLEAELLRLNGECRRFSLRTGVTGLEATVHDGSPHQVRFRSDGVECRVTADWLVDASGRGTFLARRLGLAKESPIRHGASFLWVEGLVDIEKLTDLSPTQSRLKRDRALLGHSPIWLATNHFMGEGFWFWVIPLQGKTSLGLVYDKASVPVERVSTPQKLIDWILAEFPLFGRDLPRRKILHHGSYRDFAYDCEQTISASKWALSGEAGRFSDPLYSPGGDLISLYNTLIVDAILTADAAALAAKAPLYEQLMKALYAAYVPSFAIGYVTLGDQETMTLKYAWELTVYFGFYVFPFINDLFTDPGFAQRFLRRLVWLGPINENLLGFLAAYYRWKKANASPPVKRVFFDFMELGPVRVAERAFYQVGVSADEGERVLDEQVANAEELARCIVAHVSAAVAGDPRIVRSRGFVEGIDLRRLRFDADQIRARGAAADTRPYDWSFDPAVLARFHPWGEETTAAMKEGERVWTTMRRS